MVVGGCGTGGWDLVEVLVTRGRGPAVSSLLPRRT
jgi:hypothetical protein